MGEAKRRKQSKAYFKGDKWKSEKKIPKYKEEEMMREMKRELIGGDLNGYF